MRRDNFLYIAAAIMDMSAGMVFLCVPLLANKLGASVLQMGYIGTVGGLFYSLSCPIAGRLSDSLGRKRMILFSICLFIMVYLSMTTIQKVGYIFPLVAFGSISMSMFWPSMQAWLATGKSHHELEHTIGMFNISWSIGIFIGPVIGGILFEMDYRFPFYFASAWVALLSIFFFLIPEGNVEKDKEINNEDTERDPRVVERFLYIGWLANFLTWFTGSILRNIFPKLAINIGIDPATIGRLLAATAFAQTIGYVIIWKSGRWSYKVFPLLSVQSLMIIGTVIIYLSSQVNLFAIAFALIGLSSAMAFYSSIFYSLHSQGNKGTRSGINEGVLGIGGVVGSLSGGFLASRFGLRAPYLLCTAVTIVGLAAEYIISRKALNTQQQEP